jgi:lipopolysaccharide transport system permease protein
LTVADARRSILGFEKMSNTGLADRPLLLRPHAVFSRQDLRDLWSYRELLWILALRDVKVRYKQAALGVLWAVVQPLSQVLIFTFLFHRMAGIQGDPAVPYPVFCMAGLTIWALFANGLTQASDSLISSSNLVTKVYFPRIIIPVASVITAMVDAVIASLFLFILMIVMHVSFHLSGLLIVPIVLIAAISAASFGLWTSALNLQYRDVRHALPFVIQLLVYLTPVFYSASLVPERFRGLLILNPMAAIVDGFRASLFGSPIPFRRLGVALLISLIVGGLGFVRFRRLEQTFADRV